jgi:1-acyl-sn-glycerol-3-phosphate acyltransferase
MPLKILERLSEKMENYNPAQHFDPKLGRETARRLMPIMEKYFRIQYLGLEHLPERPFLGVANHSGGIMVLDSILWVGKYLLDDRRPYMLSLVHSALGTLNTLPGFPLLQKLGMQAASRPMARRALREGFALYVCPGGERDNFRNFTDRNKINFYGHKGYVRMALEAGVPIVPIVAVGSHETMFVLWDGRELSQLLGLDKLFQLHVFPLTWSLGRGWRFGRQLPYIPLPAQITFSVLRPFDTTDFSPDDARNERLVSAIDAEIRARMQAEMDRLSKGRIPVIGRLF